MVSDPSRAQEVSWEARTQAQKYQGEFGLNVSSAAVGASRPQQQPRRIPHPGPKPVSLDACPPHTPISI